MVQGLTRSPNPCRDLGDTVIRANALDIWGIVVLNAFFLPELWRIKRLWIISLLATAPRNARNPMLAKEKRHRAASFSAFSEENETLCPLFKRNVWWWLVQSIMTHKVLDSYRNISFARCPLTLHCWAAYRIENDELLGQGRKNSISYLF